MQILYTNGYSDKQLLDFYLPIWGYLLETCRHIAQDLRDSHLEPANQAWGCRLPLDEPMT